ncbi:MAG: sulfatase-like hydrolase/transferase [Bryobacteraceae bacterium]
MRLPFRVRPKALLLCLCAFGALISCQRPGGSASQPLRPLNVVVITIDTLRPDHVHCYGYSKIETPTLDRIAQSGVLFEKGVTQTPLTPPSHASIFTGLNPPTHKVRNTGGFVLSPSTPTLASLLEQHGWDTAAFVSSAVLKKRFGFDHGFAVYDDRMPQPGSRQEFLEDAERRAGDTVDHAVEWLDGRGEKPFFLWVHLYDPHAPYDPPSPFREQYKDRLYDGEIAYADHELGRLMENLWRKSPPEKTLVAVLSDHGESLGEHGEFSHGVFLYDSTLRIAFLLSGPGVPPGLRVPQQARTIDLLPTILELLGAPAPAGIEGASLVPLFSGRDAATAVSYAETLYPKINLGWAELRAIRTNQWKYIRAPRPELYDLSRDPGETNNVLAEHPSEVRKLEARLAAATGSASSEKVETTPMDEHTLAQLKSLGYTSGFTSRSYDLNGQGADPKDQVAILKMMDDADQPHSGLSPARRIELLQRALRLDPSNPLLYYTLGAKLEKAGRYDEAMKLYRAALQNGIDKGHGRLHSRLGDLLVHAGKKAEAIPEYEEAVRINPTDVATQANLATAYMEQGRLADAERVLNGIVAIEPSNAAAQNELGVLAIQRRDGTAARAHFEKAVEFDPDLVDAYLNLGLLYKMVGDKARARASFEQFLAKAPLAQYEAEIPKVRAALAELH